MSELQESPLFYRDTWVEVNLDAIEANIKAVKEFYHFKDMTIMAVVKANGYGHGAVEVARAAIQSGANQLAVAIFDEALELRRAGIDVPILVMGRIRPTDARLAQKERITVTVFQRDWIVLAKDVLDRQLPALKIHIKVDTGMGRIGLRTKDELIQIINELKTEDAVELDGMFTHFATADDLNPDYFLKQYHRFEEMLGWLKELNMNIPHIHCGNSATGLRYPNKTFNMFRFGISMYGLTPSIDIKGELPFPLQQAFVLKTKLSHVKRLEAGESISYGATYTTKETEWIGTLPIGYADGWIRKNSTNGGFVLVNGEKAPFVGRICMDQCMIRLPREYDIDTEVILISDTKELSMDVVAERLETINYEIPCITGDRIPRVYMKNGKCVKIKTKYDEIS
ncbi:alanine racemase [Alkalihalobacillus pseudalcaliphilus]|uniref:alanine racemase n=1 Tax=Alkalihalobacillus pseudalcaliphilus TaxID=79884 RepID=UPI00064D9E72|nr:alanine racemase [Alkalihalobacillus pseudalcaliphilus]KMK76921.1 alanine racemase [Alkalihalobacillus pseudalcaliphilus]